MSKTGPQVLAATEEVPGYQPVLYLVSGLCAFIALLAFKPSEPYLSDYLICDKDTAEQECSGAGGASSCSNKDQCYWSEGSCRLTACSDVSQGDCGDGPDNAFSYCETDGDVCRVAECYKHFSADQVNNDIYPVSTYAYLPLLLLLGTGAELVSYRAAVLVGAFGRVLTRFLLLYTDSVPAMQTMQVCYSAGTAAEDVFAAFVFKAVPFHQYQLATSLTKVCCTPLRRAPTPFSSHSCNNTHAPPHTSFLCAGSGTPESYAVGHHRGPVGRGRCETDHPLHHFHCVCVCGFGGRRVCYCSAPGGR